MMDEELEDVGAQSEETELYEHHRFVVDKGQSPMRIDKYLFMHIVNASRNKIQNAAHAGNIVVNDKPIKPNYRIKPDDIISVLLAYPPRETTIIPENIPLDIVYEDNDVIVINKKPGMVVHPGFGNFSGTLVHALAYHFKQQGIDESPYLVHRIDKDTSGLLLVAKNELAQSIIARGFFDHKIDRKYIALVWGNVKDDEGTIEGHIGRHLVNRMQMAVFADGTHGKEALTHYKVIKRYHYVTLVECVLETGRTHQIRAHMKYLGHTLFNDERYGGNEVLKGTTFSKYKQFVQNCFELMPRQGLHAQSLGFTHPSTGKDLYFEAPVPPDMQAVIDKWERYVSQINEEDIE